MQPLAVIEGQHGVRVLIQLDVARLQQQTARHAQVNEQRVAAAQGKEQELTPSLRSDEGLPLQPPAKLLGGRPVHDPLPADPDSLDLPSPQTGPELVDDGLDFRQFRHEACVYSSSAL